MSKIRTLHLTLLAGAMLSAPLNVGAAIYRDGFTDWMSLGGPIASDVALARNRDGRLEVFALGTNNAVIHQSELIDPSNFECFPDMTANPAWHSWQTTWSGWQSLGGTFVGTPAVGQNADGRLEVFARGADNIMYHIWQTTPGGGWSDWGSLGWRIGGNPAVGTNKDGRLEVFARGTDNKIYHQWQVTANGGWSTPGRLGGDLVAQSDPAVGANADGRLEIFVTLPTSNIYHIWQLEPGYWSQWSALGAESFFDAPVVVRSKTALHVFARGFDNRLYHRYQLQQYGTWGPITGEWSSWTSLGGPFVSLPGSGYSPYSGLEVSARGADNSIYDITQTSTGGGWTPWLSMGGSFSGKPSVALNHSFLALEIFARGSNGILYRRAEKMVITDTSCGPN